MRTAPPPLETAPVCPPNPAVIRRRSEFETREWRLIEAKHNESAFCYDGLHPAAASACLPSNMKV
jgi:hypothetical protein